MQYDLTKANPGRMFDYWLGGTHNFEIDRQFADHVAKQFPVVREQIKIERGRLKSVVQFFYEHGIRAIVDLGSSLPTCGNTHEVAHAIDPQIQVVYSDIDPITTAYGQELLLGKSNVIYMQADASTPLDLLDAPETRAFLGDNHYIGIIASQLGHMLTDAQWRNAFQTLYDWAARGSYCAVTLPSKEWVIEPSLNQMVETYKRANIQSYYRSREEIKPLVAPWKLTAAGITDAARYDLPGPGPTKTIVISYAMMLHKE